MEEAVKIKESLYILLNRYHKDDIRLDVMVQTAYDMGLQAKMSKKDYTDYILYRDNIESIQQEIEGCMYRLNLCFSNVKSLLNK